MNNEDKKYKILEVRDFVKRNKQGIALWNMLSGKRMLDTDTEKLCYAVGFKDKGKKYYGNFKRWKHILVAGELGMGKSTFLHNLLLSIMSQHSPDEVRFLLIDTKGTEFSMYKAQPHLLVNEVVSNAEKAIRYLKWASEEMQRRFNLFFGMMEKYGIYTTNIDEYNKEVEPENRLKKIIIVIDEIAELLNVDGEKFAEFFYFFVMKCVASGIYIVVSTANLNEKDYSSAYGLLGVRIVFRVATKEQSNLVLRENGAEELKERECMCRMYGINNFVKLKVPYLNEEDELKFLNYIKENNEAAFDDALMAYIKDNE